MSASLACAADPGIPSLAVVLDQVALRRILGELRLAHEAVPHDLEIRLLRHHPGKRCVFEIIDSGDSPRAWIGKVFAADRADVFDTMAAIQRSGFGPEAEFSIPAPIAYVPELNLLVQEKVTGAPATELFLAADEDDRHRISERCAQWLARFHKTVPLPGPRFDPAQYQLSIQKWSDWIAAVASALGNRAGQLRRQLECAAPDVAEDGLRTCHGSFTHHQVIAAHGRIVTFDWDDHILIDPVFDVARFIVGLRRLALRSLTSIRALDAVVDTFLHTYRSAHGSVGTANLLFYAAAICLRLAKKDIRQQTAESTEKAEATLEEGLRILQQGI